MTKTMKPMEIANALNQLGKVTEREKKYCDAMAKTKFSTGVAIAIARNKKKLEHEFKMVADIEERNKDIAKKRKVELQTLPEQMELMKSEIEVEIATISLSELEKGNDLISEDFYDLFFMTEEGEEGKLGQTI